jgi:hypothetical protein
MRDGEQRPLYVTPFTLTGPFTSVLSGFLDGSRSEPRSAVAPLQRNSVRFLAAHGRFLGTDDWPRTTIQPHRGTVQRLSRSIGPALQSTGGRNRFLAVDPETGTTHSVGWSGSHVVEWRPFWCESVIGSLPNTRLVLDGIDECPVDEAELFLVDRLHKRITRSDGRLDASTALRTDRMSLMATLADVADEVHRLHSHGVVHGDIKPDNVLLLKSGVTLIDSFDVEAGVPAPGWTPDWSAPEQVRGEQVHPAADVYPLAVMAVQVLGGEIVGEVRKYRTPRGTTMPGEVDLFHSPSLYVADGLTGTGLSAWRELIERSLSFDPDRRPSTAEFATGLRDLLDRHPVPGTATRASTGKLMATRMIDGAETVARVVSHAGRG